MKSNNNEDLCVLSLKHFGFIAQLLREEQNILLTLILDKIATEEEEVWEVTERAPMLYDEDLNYIGTPETIRCYAEEIATDILKVFRAKKKQREANRLNIQKRWANRPKRRKKIE